MFLIISIFVTRHYDEFNYCNAVICRRAVHGLKKEVLRRTSHECAVVYGALPPSTRREQAALFNGDEAVAAAATDNDSERKGDLDQFEESSGSGSRVSAHGREGLMKDDGADARRQSSSPPQQQPRGVLVASDAIGMGLNLNIRRVIFTSMHKYDGEHEDRVDDGMWDRARIIFQGWINVIRLNNHRKPPASAACRHGGQETASF